MPTQEERIAALEQTAIPRIDFIHGINRLTLQLAQTASDLSHEITIMLGVVGSQGQDIKTLKEDVSTLKGDASNIKERLDRLETKFDRLETKFDNQTVLLTQILTRLPEKP